LAEDDAEEAGEHAQHQEDEIAAADVQRSREKQGG
jgi:hypothetical protein